MHGFEDSDSNSRPPRVVVAIPSTGKIHHACMESVRAMMRATLRANEVTFWWHNGQPHDRCRNALFDRFRGDPTWTHLLFLDTDVVVPPDALDRLIACDTSLVCAPVPVLHHRYGPPDQQTGITVGTNIRVFDDPALRGGVVDPEEPACGYRRVDPDDFPTEPFPCDAAGLGVCLIKREVVERIEPPWCAFVGQKQDQYIGEDVYFFRKARVAGFKLLVEPTILCDHYKSLDLTHLDLLYTDAPPVSPWPARHQPNVAGNVFVVVRVPRTGWLDIRMVDCLEEWQRRYGDRVLIERIFADTVRGGFVALAERIDTLDPRYTHVLMMSDDIVPHPATLGLMAAVDAPVVSALSRTLIDGEISWSFFERDPLSGALNAPQNISLPDLAEPFEVPSIDPACVLIRRETLRHVQPVMQTISPGPNADRLFAHQWCQAVISETGQPPLQIPLTVERKAEVGLLGLLHLKIRLKEQCRAQMEGVAQTAPTP